MKKRIMLITVIITTFFIVGLTIKTNLSQSATKIGYTIHYRVTHILNDGNTIESNKVRYVSSTGAFHDIETLPSGAKKETIFVPQKGVFRVNNKLEKIQKIEKATAILPDSPTAEKLKSSKQFVKTDSLLGYQTYLNRIKDPSTNLPASDVYEAVEFPFTPLKTIIYDPNGKIVLTSEAISITKGEPDASLLVLPSYPTN